MIYRLRSWALKQLSFGKRLGKLRDATDVSRDGSVQSGQRGFRVGLWKSPWEILRYSMFLPCRMGRVLAIIQFQLCMRIPAVTIASLREEVLEGARAASYSRIIIQKQAHGNPHLVNNYTNKFAKIILTSQQFEWDWKILVNGLKFI